MKIVLNKCIGAFDLSPIAIREYCKLKGKQTYFYALHPNGVLNKVMLEIAQKIDSNKLYITTKDFGMSTMLMHVNHSYIFNVNSIRRDDKDLIYVLNKYTDKAYPSTTTLLQIVDIPLGVTVRITNTHGFEITVEKFDSLMK